MNIKDEITEELIDTFYKDLSQVCPTFNMFPIQVIDHKLDENNMEGVIMTDIIKVFESYLKMLNCKNIGIKSIRRKSKTMSKKNKLRIDPRKFEYRVIDLDLTPTEKINYEDSEVTGSYKGMHECQGHFKEFTKEKPLFGKHVGLWWWGHQIRGGKKDKIISKEYDTKRNLITNVKLWN